MNAKTCSTPGCWKTVYGPGDLCGKCLDGLKPTDRGPVTNTELLRARLAKQIDEGVTRARLQKHGQLRALAHEVLEAAREALGQGRRPQTPAPRALSVFVSYAHEHRTVVLQIEQYLRSYGHRTWMDVYELKTLEHLDRNILAAIGRCEYFVACLSESCKDASRYVFRELSVALERVSSEKYLYLLPVVLDGTQPAAEFAPFSPIYLTSPSALDELGLTLEIGGREVI